MESVEANKADLTIVTDILERFNRIEGLVHSGGVAYDGGGSESDEPGESISKKPTKAARKPKAEEEEEEEEKEEAVEEAEEPVEEGAVPNEEEKVGEESPDAQASHRSLVKDATQNSLKESESKDMRKDKAGGGGGKDNFGGSPKAFETMMFDFQRRMNNEMDERLKKYETGGNPESELKLKEMEKALTKIKNTVEKEYKTELDIIKAKMQGLDGKKGGRSPVAVAPVPTASIGASALPEAAKEEMMRELKELKKKVKGWHTNAMTRIVSIETNIDRVLTESDTMMEHYRRKLFNINNQVFSLEDIRDRVESEIKRLQQALQGNHDEA